MAHATWELPERRDESSLSLEKRDASEAERLLENVSSEGAREDEHKRSRGDASRDATKRPAVALLRAGDRLTTPGQMKRVRSEGCVLKRHQLICSSTLPITTCYHLGEVIGVGTWCTVRTAVERFSGLERVVKRVCKETHRAELPQFRQEIALCRQLDHPNIARLYETFEDHRYIYLVFEYCRGGDLLSWLHARQDARRERRKRSQATAESPGEALRLNGDTGAGARRGEGDGGDASGGEGAEVENAVRGDRKGPVDDERPICSEMQAARFMIQLLSALSYLHRKGIAHRDLKLENILLVHPFEGRDEGDRDSTRSERAESAVSQPPLPPSLSHPAPSPHAFPTQDSAAPQAEHTERRGESDVAVPSNACRPGVGDRQACVSADLPCLRALAPETNFSDSIALADFGLARRFTPGGARERPTRRRLPSRTASSAGLSASGVMTTRVGTLYYLSPFLLKGVPYDEVQSDMWAAGVVLYMLISGAPPFEGNSEAEVSAKILTTRLAFKEPCWRHVSEDCKDLVCRLLHNPFLAESCSAPSIANSLSSSPRPLSVDFLSAANRSPPTLASSPTAGETPTCQRSSLAGEKAGLLDTPSCPDPTGGGSGASLSVSACDLTCVEGRDSGAREGESASEATETGQKTFGIRAWQPGILRRMDAATTLTHPWFVAVQRQLWAKVSGPTLSMSRSTSSPAFHQGHGHRVRTLGQDVSGYGHVVPFGAMKGREETDLRIFSPLSPSISSGSLCSSTSVSPSPSSASLASSLFASSLSPSPSSASLVGLACGAWGSLEASGKARRCAPGGIPEGSPAYIRETSPSDAFRRPLPKSMSSPNVHCALYQAAQAKDEVGSRGPGGRGSPEGAAAAWPDAASGGSGSSTRWGEAGDRTGARGDRRDGDGGCLTGRSPSPPRPPVPGNQVSPGASREDLPELGSAGSSWTAPSLPCAAALPPRGASPPAASSPALPEAAFASPAGVPLGVALKGELPARLLAASRCSGAALDPDQAAIFHCRFLLLLGATSWRRFAGLGPLQRALRTVVAREMEDELEVRVLREIFCALDRGHRGALAPDDIVWGLGVAKDLVTSECQSCLIQASAMEIVVEGKGEVAVSSLSPEDLSGLDASAARPLRMSLEDDVAASSSAKREECFEPILPSTRLEEVDLENKEETSRARSERDGGGGMWRVGDISSLAACPLGSVALPPSLRSLRHLAGLTSSHLGPPVGEILPYLLNLHAFLGVAPPAFLSVLSSSWPQWTTADRCEEAERPRDAGDGLEATGDREKPRREGEEERWTVHDVVAGMDTDGSGNIEFVEFVAASLADADIAGRESLGRAAFRYFDRSFDGLVSYRDLLGLLSLQPASPLCSSFSAMSPGVSSSLPQGCMSHGWSRQPATPCGVVSADACNPTGGESGGVWSPKQNRTLQEADSEDSGEALGVGEGFLSDLEHVTRENLSLYRAVLKQIQAVDKDKDGYITYDEFLLLMR
ncbi:putative EF hand domain-containing protein [Neospora caninum Liverpool]|uniref:non-specific serine/threonine protein kinase n=1 Tax=Neospora caninum (strain Liverpool) TaxID=572307 RepID=F0VCX8_NEOCL|nr:putative EF hand domain-containing protein [Neospora caninum Liverpool]CBZ51493.1 putative EF hand domain-containing protein [Neospora caninum Liverpool]CEL65443.1 TPA: EF hand domain-containing protein, putative [Neospora caninum Liverpool]|eukprot:XP_003881526.1 putative EF hand domain-containing protein [Neospora caninum Liverpool]